MLPIWPVIVLVRALTSGSRGATSSGGSKSFSGTGRAVLWVVCVVGWATMLLLTLLTASDCFGPSHATGELAWFVSFCGLDVVGACGLFFAWPILRALARYGRPKLVYRLAHFCLIFPSTGETYAGATLLAGIALAHRGAVTKKEIAWLQSRLEREYRCLGTFGAAFGLIEALKAKRARDKRRPIAAEHAQRARTLFGTLTYLSPRAIPKNVLRFAYEYLALDDARLAHWGAVLLAPKSDATPVVRAIAGWVRQHDAEKPKPYETRARRRLASPIIEKLFARPKESTGPKDAADARAHLARDYNALLAGEPLGPRAALNLLTFLDMFTHPEFPDTLVPEEIRGDEALVASIHDDVAASLREPLLRTGIPIYAMRNIGPISARVYQSLETALIDELKTALDRCNEHKKLAHRRDPFTEWLEVSYVRAVYRRIEFTLGPDAAARVWRPFAYGYCNLGVLLSETWPRRRPLAFSVFRVLSLEAHKYKDREQAEQQLHNMTVTSGVQ